MIAKLLRREKTQPISDVDKLRQAEHLREHPDPGDDRYRQLIRIANRTPQQTAELSKYNATAEQIAADEAAVNKVKSRASRIVPDDQRQRRVEEFDARFSALRQRLVATMTDAFRKMEFGEGVRLGKMVFEEMLKNNWRADLAGVAAFLDIVQAIDTEGKGLSDPGPQIDRSNADLEQEIGTIKAEHPDAFPTD